MILILLISLAAGLKTHPGNTPIHTVVLKQVSPKAWRALRRHAASSFTELSHTLVSEEAYRTLVEHQAQVKRGHTYTVAPDGIIPLINLRDSQYVGPIGVGTLADGSPQSQINVVFDTGSTNLWISSSLCKREVCRERNKFNPSKSVSFVSKDSPNLDITFGTGELKGPQGDDAFSVGPYRVVNQTFALIEDEIGSIFSQIPFEGILGLAFPSMAAEGHMPFFDNVMRQDVLKGRNEFSFYFTKLPTQASAVFFGGVDDRFYEGPIHMFPVTQTHYWSLTLKDFLIGNDSYATVPEESYYNAGVKVSKLIADTGTTYFTAPPGIADKILNVLKSTECSQIDNYPNLTYKLVDQFGADFDLVVPPSVYMVGTGSTFCEPAFMEIPVPSAYGPAFLLGEVFMRHWHTTFDRGDGSPGSAFIGFAPAKHDKEAINALLMGRTASGSIAGI